MNVDVVAVQVALEHERFEMQPFGIGHRSVRLMSAVSGGSGAALAAAAATTGAEETVRISTARRENGL
ncbi:hypothetical protein [Mesorhizobium sp. WSM3860]|uniref:hypothetical protein n=1 Tax=Mesorhizobium sp. WSM3860 TaxID=2029403 RepID=UPI000BAFC6F6|nr:hypothetical protein [Mesorhizobium sp. WSM3860]PBC04257.1 hypothetical protein CK220_11610 [Mesorhizobium sp. WSM3860]